MLYGQDYVFTCPIAFHGTVPRHQEDRAQGSIDLMILEFAVYNHSGLTLFKKSWTEIRTTRLAWSRMSAAKPGFNLQ